MLDNRLGVFVLGVTVVALLLLLSVGLNQMKSQEPQERTESAQERTEVAREQLMPKDDSKVINMNELANRPYRPAKIELFQPEDTFEIVGMDVNKGTELHWVLVARNLKTKDGTIFRALLGNPDAFGSIEHGKVVRLGLLQFWQNQNHWNEVLVVLGIE